VFVAGHAFFTSEMEGGDAMLDALRTAADLATVVAGVEVVARLVLWLRRRAAAKKVEPPE
jgi:hypothetical protein